MMILSKNSLQVVNLCTPDKNIQVLNNVCIEPDGSVIASNSRVYALVSPLSRERVKIIPLENSEVVERIVLSADTVKEIIKAMPKDTQFKGLLEHCDIRVEVPGKPGVVVTLTDGKRMHEIKVRRVSPEYINYKKIFVDAYVSVEAMGRAQSELEVFDTVCLNRKRLANVQEVMDKVCSYDGSFAPVWFQFGIDGEVIIRSINEITDQRFIAVFIADRNELPNLDSFEQKLFNRVRTGKAMKIV